MKRYLVGILLGLLALGVQAQEASAPKAEVKAEGTVKLPDGVSTDPNPMKKEFVEKSGKQALLFRPNENMPEIVNEGLLKTMAGSGKLPEKASQFIGYIPKLKVLPCAKGCEGADYEKAVAAFVKAYNGNGKTFKLRGEMLVQVRWFNTRPWFQFGLPYGEDRFGISFIMEGKLVSLGRSSGLGTRTTAVELASALGTRLGVELGVAAGAGLKPTFLVPTDPGVMANVEAAMGKFSGGIATAMGSEDVTSRLEPVTEAHKQLLPAIDGIKPGEVDPITEPRYLYLRL